MRYKTIRIDHFYLSIFYQFYKYLSKCVKPLPVEQQQKRELFKGSEIIKNLR